MKIAFVGLGHMGLPMAKNLLKAGHQVSGFDLSHEALEALAQAGGLRASSLQGCIAEAEAIITMLPASKHVEDTYLGEQGVLAKLRAAAKRPLLVDCTTISPEAARKVAAAAQQQGLLMVDAPVSGGTAGAEAGTLTFMVGGPVEALEQARPLLDTMGKNIFHAGDSGSGQTAKVCNNMLLGILMLGTSEALRLGIANGLDPKVLSAIMSKSSSRNWALETYNPCPGVMENSPASREYKGGFAVKLMLKDLGLAVENALSTQSSIPLGSLARNLYDLHNKAGNGSLDFSSVFNMLADH